MSSFETHHHQYALEPTRPVRKSPSLHIAVIGRRHQTGEIILNDKKVRLGIPEKCRLCQDRYQSKNDGRNDYLDQVFDTEQFLHENDPLNQFWLSQSNHHAKMNFTQKIMRIWFSGSLVVSYYKGTK